ncbi:MAG: thioredoxin-dependent thiol peroxidase [Bacteroidetes bacterium]|nr:thioredoxin-dependent thiol peroxidase [Bacteroidota bacterium]MBU1797935.1 thioredoxin-dependent thiol peroxidase [Bacteroidota bacterium]
MEVSENKKAPQFSLPDSDGNLVKLKQFLGQKVVLYFYPKDNTSGCTAEACDFNNSLKEFDKIKTKVLGLSKDSPKSHIKFRDKFDLNFTLLSDETTEIIQKYGVWKEKSMYGKKYMGVERTTFIIDEKGKIEKIFPKVKVNGHVQEILNYLAEK